MVLIDKKSLFPGLKSLMKGKLWLEPAVCKPTPLFLGLARPAMIMGVNYLFVVLNFAVSMIAFINTTSFLVLLVMLPGVHIIAYIICLKEVRALELLILKVRWGIRCMNRRYHGHTNSYDIY